MCNLLTQAICLKQAIGLGEMLMTGWIDFSRAAAGALTLLGVGMILCTARWRGRKCSCIFLELILTKAMSW